MCLSYFYEIYGIFVPILSYFFFLSVLCFFNNVWLHYAGNADEPNKSSLSARVSEQKSSACLQNATMLSDQHCPAHSASVPPDSGFM